MGEPLAIDMAALIESLLDEQRTHIQAKRLLVLKELDRARPFALGHEVSLRAAIAGLLARAIDQAPERGDLYFATQHRTETPDQPEMRILLRYRVSEVRSDSDLALETLGDTSLHIEVAEAVLERQGGRLRIDSTDPAETLVVIDLPAPGHPG